MLPVDLLLILLSKSVRFLSTFLLRAVGKLQAKKGTQCHWLQLGILTPIALDPVWDSVGTWHRLTPEYYVL